MNSKDIIKVCGSITKKESLVKLKENILPHTVVAEANLPYSNYYGRIPRKAKPNSLFLFTERFYSLEEALRFNQNVDFCTKNEVDVASAIMQFNNDCSPAIRIKNFPDYENLENLQNCYAKQGMKFSRRQSLESETMVTVNKCFELKKAEEGIFFDEKEKDEGYILVSKYLKFEQFEQLMRAVFNNSKCRIFDEAQGGLIIDGKAFDIIRVYSEHLDIELLKCVQKEIAKQIEQF